MAHSLQSRSLESLITFLNVSFPRCLNLKTWDIKSTNLKRSNWLDFWIYFAIDDIILSNLQIAQKNKMFHLAHSCQQVNQILWYVFSNTNPKKTFEPFRIFVQLCISIWQDGPKWHCEPWIFKNHVCTFSDMKTAPRWTVQSRSWRWKYLRLFGIDY